MVNNKSIENMADNTELLSNDVKRPYRGDNIVKIIGYVVVALTIISIIL
jgi:hypothetical protein